jgi:hypothetical protein
VLHGEECIDVRFFDGNDEDAFVLAVELNRAHGLPLSLADRMAAAARIITSHPHWSDRRIAVAVGVAANTVGTLRRRSTVQDEQSNGTIGRDGRVRPRDSTQGRQRAGELIRQDPDAPLRKIAKAAGISLATASDVRARIGRGEPPTIAPRYRSAAQAAERAIPHSRLPPEARANVVQNLRLDPSLRFTDTGRALLRFLDACTIDTDRWLQIIDSVPPHCKNAVVYLAKECANSWQDFADQLAQRPDYSTSDTAE